LFKDNVRNMKTFMNQSNQHDVMIFLSRIYKARFCI
jgi:hypothetical protein